ncbi:RlpA-like double-psi beta-barrel-protein domain-containing protein-containing protein [Irpex rosettiformis]|uniref:RlpA-like double-psi beta-barrel-protein domain-containing protein-containing protein n=1 Tax=Irpex rosettiformis TaxID=378272 RepID=A0ACB8UK73_9APHY|nr:RlpA-like double-psi beta-barrel-protein domain-containing protein-containing protein [Irpex rosettiformis]
MYFSKLFVIFTAVTAASAMTTHFGRRDLHHRRAVAAREPELVTPTLVQVVPRPRKRANGRCKTSSPASSAALATTSAAANAGNDPPTFISSSVEHTTATPTKEPTTQASPTTHTPTTSHTTATPSPTSGSSSSGGNGDIHTGEGTYYATGLGSCGITNKDADFIAAVSHILYDQHANGANPNNNALCNKKATATYKGKSVTVTITDRCTGCAEYDLDFSPSAFSQLADQSIGRIYGMTWQFDD